MDASERAHNPLCVLVVGCKPVIEQGAASLLSSQPQWSVQFQSLDQCQALCGTLPHVAVVVAYKLATPEIRCIRLLKAYPTKVVVYGVTPSFANIRQAISAGADSFVHAGATMEELLAAIEACASGHHPIVTGNEANQLINTLKNTPSPLKPAAVDTTEREQEVLALITKGLTNEEIAQQLHMAVGTVKTHVYHLLRKYGLKSRTQLAVSCTQIAVD